MSLLARGGVGRMRGVGVRSKSWRLFSEQPPDQKSELRDAGAPGTIWAGGFSPRILLPEDFLCLSHRASTRRAPTLCSFKGGDTSQILRVSQSPGSRRDQGPSAVLFLRVSGEGSE